MNEQKGEGGTGGVKWRGKSDSGMLRGLTLKSGMMSGREGFLSTFWVATTATGPLNHVLIDKQRWGGMGAGAGALQVGVGAAVAVAAAG